MKKLCASFFVLGLLTTSAFAGSSADVQKKPDLQDKVQSTSLTIYKDAALVQQVRSFAATENSHSFKGIPNSVLQESFMMVPLSQENGFEITEFGLIPGDGNHSDLTAHLSLNNTAETSLKQLQLFYLFKNLEWRINYTLHFSPNYETVKLNAWIEIDNSSGIAFPKSQVQFIDRLVPVSFLALNPLEQNDKLPHNNEIQPQEYSHAYVLADSVDIPAQGVKRISWANSQTIKAKQDFRLFVGGHYLDDMEGKNAYPTTETWISFQNIKEQNQLGSPLPQGDATLYRTDEKGGIEVLGKAAIPHTATGQDVSVKIPQTQAEKSSTNAQDGQALQNLETVLEQTEFKKLGEKITEAGYRLALKNKGNHPITIRVTLDLPKSEWTITRENISHQQNGDQQVFWTIQVGANSSIDLKYRIRLILA